MIIIDTKQKSANDLLCFVACSPSRAVFFSTINPHHTGVYFNGVNTYTNSILSGIKLIPESGSKEIYTWAMVLS